MDTDGGRRGSNRGQSGRSLKPAFHLHLAPRLGMIGVLPPFLHMPSHRAEGQSYFIIIAIRITVKIIVIIISTIHKAPHNPAWNTVECFGLSLGYNTRWFKYDRE